MMTNPPKSHLSRPWLKLTPRPCPSEAVVLDQPPLQQLSIYADVVILTRRTATGGWRSYPIAPDALAATLSRVPTLSGLLPPGTLGTGTIGGQPLYVLAIPPMRQVLQIARDATRATTRTITLPPLIWAALGGDYRVWALDTLASPTPSTPLMRAPFPNVQQNGSICWGDVGRPGAAMAQTVRPALDAFLTSRFNTHLDNGKSVRKPASVLALYAELEADQPYPLDDLMPAERSLGWLLAGGPWGGAQ
jgi:hypothetical protein